MLFISFVSENWHLHMQNMFINLSMVTYVTAKCYNFVEVSVVVFLSVF